MSNGKKKTSSIDDKLVAFSDRIEKALEKERKKRAADRKEREEHRREVAVEMGRLRDMWGQLAEFVVESGILGTLKRYDYLDIDNVLPNIDVHCQGEDGEREHGEIDIIASGERDLVVIETKTTLQVGDVNYFLNKYLIDYSRWQASSPLIHLPSCDDRRIFGCLAYMKAEGEAEKIAVKKGLITVHVFGDSSSLANPHAPLIDYHPDRYQR